MPLIKNNWFLAICWVTNNTIYTVFKVWAKMALLKLKIF
jgi:hypothetical protein